MKTEYTLKKTLSLTMAHCNRLWSLDRSATRQEPSRQNGDKGEQAEAGERRDQGRRHHVGRIEIDPAIELTRRETGAISHFLGCDHAVEPGSEQSEKEAAGYAADRGRGHERAQPHRAQRSREIGE